MTYQEFKTAVITVSEEMQVSNYELYYAESESTSVETYRQEVKEYSTENSMGVCYRCIVEGSTGYASTENLTGEEARSLVLRALENAKSIESGEQPILHKKGDTYATLPANTAKAPTGAELTDAALALQKEMYAADSRVTDGTQSYVGYVRASYALYNSNGLDLEDKISYALGMGDALIPDGEDMYNGGKVKEGNLEDLDMKEIAAQAVEDALSGIGAVSVSSGKYAIVFTSRAFSQLLTTFDPVFSAEEAQKGMSLLAGKEGERIAADIVTIVDDPLYRDSPVKRTFDGEGVATYQKNVVENGILKTLLHNLSTAAKAGVKSTGNGRKISYSSTVGVGPSNLYLKPVEGAREELLKAAGNGICIKEVSGLHAGANSITGDFSLLAEGYLFENGERTVPVKNITVSGNFFDVLKEIEKVGADLEFIRAMGGRCGSPSVLVRDMTIAGKG